MQHRLVANKRRFGITYQSHQSKKKHVGVCNYRGTRVGILLGLFDPRRWGPIGCPETSVTTNLLRVTSQNSDDLIFRIVHCWVKWETQRKL
jgi:hypothetical protein